MVTRASGTPKHRGPVVRAPSGSGNPYTVPAAKNAGPSTARWQLTQSCPGYISSLPVTSPTQRLPDAQTSGDTFSTNSSLQAAAQARAAPAMPTRTVTARLPLIDLRIPLAWAKARSVARTGTTSGWVDAEMALPRATEKVNDG
jgi:hypothetical protein